ncbi:MAG: energy transducer TonB [Bacteroidia bacterium]
MKVAEKIFTCIFIGFLLSSFSLSNSTVRQSEKPFVIVGQMPHFPGGKLAMNRYISEHLIYPFEAMKHNVQGKVNVEFVVEKDGSLIQIKTVGKKLGYGLEEGALKLFGTMPKWIPGKQDGKLVPVYMMIPIIFSL